MARRKRASIRGRGAAILFGEKVPPEKIVPELTREEVDIEELLGEEAALAAPELNADLEKAFGEEVTAMEPVPPTPVTPAEEPVPPKAPEVVSPPPEVPPTPVTPAAEPAPPKATEVVSPPLEVPPSSEPRRVSVTLRVEEPSPPPTVPAPKVEEAPPVTPPPEMPPRRWEEPAYELPPGVATEPAPKVEEAPPVTPAPPEAPPQPEMPARRWEEPAYEPPPGVAAEPAPKAEEAPPVTPASPEVPPQPEMPARRWEETAYGPPPYLPEAGPPPESLSEAAPAVPSGRPLVSPYDRPPPEIKPGGYLVDHPVDAGEGAGLPTGVVPHREERVEAERSEEIPPQISREISERTVLGRVGEKRQRDLLNEIDLLFVETARILSVDKGLEEALAFLRDARDILIERPRQFDRAEYLVAKVRARLERKQNIAQWSLIYGYPVLLYEVVWFVLFLSSLLFDHALAVFIANMTGMTFADPTASLSMEHIFPLWNTMAWGGIGGVVGALYSLYWHAAVEQDFDKQYIMWYIVQPIMGIILGGIVYLVIAAGFISIQVLAAQAADFGDAAQAMTNPAIKAFHSVVACIAGFRQRFVYEMLDKIVQVLTPKPKTKAELEAERKEQEETG